MTTQYPVKFNKGKLVRYTKPQKYISKYETFYKEIGEYETIELYDIMNWINSHGGSVENTNLYIRRGFGDYGVGELTLTVPMSEKDIEAQEKKYQKDLKEYQEWVVLSKDAIMTEDEKNKATRAKALKTQENNLLKKLSKIRKEQEKI